MLSDSGINPSDNTKLQLCGAWASFGMPLCYIGMFVIFGVILKIPQSDVLLDKIEYVGAHQMLISVAYIVGYLIFGSLLLIAVQAIHNRLKTQSSDLLNSASSFGLIWVVLMMCSGMIALVGMNTMISLHSQASPHTETLFYIYTTIVNALGGGIELVGGLWVLLLSICGLSQNQLSKGLHFLGIVVGLLGVLTVIQSIPEFKEAFGLSQIVWFIWIGWTLLPRQKSASSAPLL